MDKVSKKIDVFNEKIGILTAYLAIPLILITFLVAFMRYVFDFGNIAFQEITIYLHALIFTIGASYTGEFLRHNFFFAAYLYINYNY